MMLTSGLLKFGGGGGGGGIIHSPQPQPPTSPLLRVVSGSACHSDYFACSVQ